MLINQRKLYFPAFFFPPGKIWDTPCNLMVLVASESSLEIWFTWVKKISGSYRESREDNVQPAVDSPLLQTPYGFSWADSWNKLHPGWVTLNLFHAVLLDGLSLSKACHSCAPHWNTGAMYFPGYLPSNCTSTRLLLSLRVYIAKCSSSPSLVPSFKLWKLSI